MLVMLMDVLMINVKMVITKLMTEAVQHVSMVVLRAQMILHVIHAHPDIKPIQTMYVNHAHLDVKHVKVTVWDYVLNVWMLQT